MHNMKTSFYCASLTNLLVIVLGPIIVVNFGVVYASTEVSGIIGSDATWKKADSPYYLTGNVLIGNVATLTIEAGVTVGLNDFYIMVNGTLRAQGTEAEQIQFNEGKITFTEHSTDWDEKTGSGCIIENVNLDSTYVDIGSVSTKIINNSISTIRVAYETIMENNTIHEKVTFHSGASGTLSHNFISGRLEIISSNILVSNNTIFGEVYISGGSSIISNNTVTGGVDVSGGSNSSDFPVITKNHIIGGEAGISCNGYALISDNNISDCTSGIRTYVVQVFGGTAVAYPLIERNLLTHNIRGITIILSSRFEPKTLVPTIQNNTIANNSVGIYLYITNYGASPTILYNNIHDNSEYNVQLDENTENDVNATYNWWGTTDTQTINQTIYDFKKDFTLGNVQFVPFLTEPNPEEMSTPIPELPSWTILPLVIVATLVGVIIRNKIRKKGLE